MQGRLDAIKESFQAAIRHWRKEWRDAATIWTASIVIVPGLTIQECDYVVFPTVGDSFDSIRPTGYYFAYNRVTLLSWNNSIYNVETAINCRNGSLDHKCGLLNVPVNLAVDAFRHFIVGLGGKFGLEQLKSHLCQWLYVDDDNKRHSEIIHSSLANSFSDTSTTCDRWERIWASGIQLNAKLSSTHYIDGLLYARRLHQVKRMIQYHFQQEKIIATANRFFNLLTYHSNSGEIKMSASPHHILLVSSAIFIRSVIASCAKRKLAKNFKLKDVNNSLVSRDKLSLAILNKDFVKNLGELTTDDVHFLFRLCIDAHYDQEDSLDRVTQLNSAVDFSSTDSIDSTLSSSFPSAADNFFNFDFPHLTGVLAETVLSQKLASYALGKEEIVNGGFATIAPTALTNIVADYHSIDDS